MSLNNLPGLPQPSTLSSQSSRPSWTGDLPQRLRRWLTQVFLSQSTIPIPLRELKSPCQSWVNTQTLLPTTQGDIGLSVELETRNHLSPGIRENSPKVELGHQGPPTSWSLANTRTYTNARPSIICRSLAKGRTLPHNPPLTKCIE